MAIQQFLPGFEDMANDANRHETDKQLKRELLQVTREYTALKDCYSSPYKLLSYENRIKKLMKAREDLWKTHE